MKSIILGFVVLTCSVVVAQEGDVKIIKDNRIDALVNKQSNIIPPAINPEIDGYRIQLFFDSDRNAMNAARSRFIARYPKTDTYVEYNAPNFVLRAGDYRTRLEAEKIKSEIESTFPTSFIVKEKINLPRLEKDEAKN